MWRIFLCCLGSAVQVLLIVCFYISQTQTTFIDQDVGLINDSEPLLTVLHDARYAGISGYDFNGQTNFELTGTSRDKLE